MKVSTFIEKARALHGDKFQYIRLPDEVFYRHKVTVFCNEHGKSTEQSVGAHLVGKVACPECIISKRNLARRMSTSELCAILEDNYNGIYTFKDISEYTNQRSKMSILCSVHNTEHTAMMAVLSRGSTTCPECFEDSYGYEKIPNVEKFLEKAEVAHGDDFEYFPETFVNYRTYMKMRCIEHDLVFKMMPHKHLHGQNSCPKCVDRNRPRLPFNTFVERSAAAHGDKYLYNEDSYVDTSTPCKITCKEHAVDFMQLPETHMLGSSGCGKCTRIGVGSQESEVYDFINEAYQGEVLQNIRGEICGKLEIDIFIPDIRIGVEFNGTYYHSDKMKKRDYHRNKFESAASHNIALLTIWEHDWNNPIKRSIIEGLLINRLGLSNKTRVRASKCVVSEVSKLESKNFLSAHHIQGSPHSLGVCIGLYHEGVLASLAIFKRTGNDNWDLSRFCSSVNVNGGLSRLIKNFRAQFVVNDITTFSDRQYFSGGLYRACGFEVEGIIKEDYAVFHRASGVMHKGKWRRSSIPLRLKELGKDIVFDPSNDKRTEWQMQDEVNALRFWDCGKVKWRQTKKG